MYADSPYSLAEVLEVFRHYFEQYEAYTGAPHPPIRAVQIERIIREMPYIDETDKANSTMDIDPDCYSFKISVILSPSHSSASCRSRKAGLVTFQFRQFQPSILDRRINQLIERQAQRVYTLYWVRI